MELDDYKRLEEIDAAIASMRTFPHSDYSYDIRANVALSVANAKIKKIEIQTMIELRNALVALKGGNSGK